METMKRWRNILGLVLLVFLCIAVPNRVNAGSTVQTATPMALNDTKYDVTVKDDVREYFMITPNPGQNYYAFTLYNAGLKTVHYKLHNGPGVEYASIFDKYVYSGYNPASYTVSLNPGQSYLLEVWSSDSIAGVSVLQMTDDYANTHSQATAMALNTERSGQIEIGGLHECDFFAFNTDNSKSFYEIAISNDGNETVELTLYEGPNEAYTHESIQAYSGNVAAITKELKANYTYYIKVNGYYDRKTFYRVSVKKIVDDAGGTFKEAKKVKDGKKKSGKIQVASDEDYYVFKTAKKKTAYQLTLRNASNDDVWFTLYTRDDISSASSMVNNYHVYASDAQTIWLNLAKKHTYYIKVHGDANVSYNFTIKNSVDAIKKVAPGAFKVQDYYSSHPCITWKLTGQYAGYELFRSTHRGYGYRKIKTVSKSSGSGTYHYDDYSVRRRVTYYYKIRYYVRNNGKIVGGKFTKPHKYRRKY